MYDYKTTIKLHETDAAGILFFGNYFRIAHDAYERFMTSIGFDFRSMINDSPFLVLIVHAEADYKKSLNLGEEATISMSTKKIGRTSFTLEYHITNKAGETTAVIQTAHVAVDKKTNKPIALPEGLRTELEEIS